MRASGGSAIPRARLCPPPQKKKAKQQKSKKKKSSPQGFGWGHPRFRAGCARRLTLRAQCALRYAYLRAIPRARFPPPPHKAWAAFWRPNVWRWRESNPRPRNVEWWLFTGLFRCRDLWGYARTTHIEDFPPDLGPAAGAFRGAHSVPSSGRPESPFGRFYEPVTRRSRGLARCLRKIKRRGPVRSYRWQFCLGGLLRGPSVQPPPAPCTRVITCRNRSPPSNA